MPRAARQRRLGVGERCRGVAGLKPGFGAKNPNFILVPRPFDVDVEFRAHPLQARLPPGGRREALHGLVEIAQSLIDSA
jgi:hypothetical protein